MLTHYPLRKSDPETVNVHGHFHGGEVPTRRHVNASVEWIDYRPVRLDHLIEKIQRQSADRCCRRARVGEKLGWATTASGTCEDDSATRPLRRSAVESPGRPDGRAGAGNSRTGVARDRTRSAARAGGAGAGGTARNTTSCSGSPLL